MSDADVMKRIDDLERANRRFRVLTVLFGLTLFVFAAAGWTHRTGGFADQSITAHRIVLLDENETRAVRLEPSTDGLRVDLAPVSGQGDGDSARVRRGDRPEGPMTVGSSVVIRSGPEIVLYGPGGRRVGRLGGVEAGPLR